MKSLPEALTHAISDGTLPFASRNGPPSELLHILDLGYYRCYTLDMKTAVSIPGPLFQAAERLAKRLGMPRSRLYSLALERYVAEAQEHDLTALLNEVYAHETAELDFALAALQSVSIPRERW